MPTHALRLLTVRLALALAGLLSTPAVAQQPDAWTVPTPLDGLAALTDTSQAAARAALQIETARLDLARAEVRQATGWRHLRPRLDLYVSVSTRGLAFPSVSSQGYDPVYAAIARWPGDAWGVTASWSLDQLLDRRPAQRARAAVRVAEGRIALHHARQDQRQAAAQTRTLADARRRAERQRRADAARALLTADTDFLQDRLDAQRELLRLAEMTYEQGETGYAQLARQRLAVLDAARARALHAARLAALDATGEPDLALAAVGPTPRPDAPAP